MVVKWSSDKDQFILCHLLEDKNIKISNDVLDSMIAAWPSSFGDPPTRKAFTEHFSKIRKSNKAIAGGKFGTTAPTTPTTALAKKRKTLTSKVPAKRRKAHITSDSDNSDDDDVAPPTKTPAKRRKNIKAADDDSDDNDMDLGVKVKDEPVDEESPTKKPACRPKGEVQYAESGDEGEISHPEDADEYVEKAVVAHMTAYLESPGSADEGAEV
ncbi:hypothetical protein QM012_000528 [Aureobasidium pullulans]|uniref:Uncharacterized protein n=1 Tax=Aureobasidium pullulans TaxID=5580 RepID=A0ABR0TVY6_AURPU